MSSSNEIPTEDQREALCDLVAFVLVDIRRLTREDGNLEIEILADAFYNIP